MPCSRQRDIATCLDLESRTAVCRGDLRLDLQKDDPDAAHGSAGILACEAQDSAVLGVWGPGTVLHRVPPACLEPAHHRCSHRRHCVGRAIHTLRATEVVSFSPAEGPRIAFPSCKACNLRLEARRARAAAIKQGFTPDAWELMLRGREQAVSPVTAFTGDQGSPKSLQH